MEEHTILVQDGKEMVSQLLGTIMEFLAQQKGLAEQLFFNQSSISILSFVAGIYTTARTVGQTAILEWGIHVRRIGI